MGRTGPDRRQVRGVVWTGAAGSALPSRGKERVQGGPADPDGTANANEMCLAPQGRGAAKIAACVIAHTQAVDPIWSGSGERDALAFEKLVKAAQEGPAVSS